MRRAFLTLGLISLSCAVACGDDTTTATDSSVTIDSGGSDADTGGDAAAMCEAANTAFRDFVAANSACADASECAIIGDCGPNADFTAVRADSTDEAFRLMQLRCMGSFDGPTYVAACESGVCTRVADGSFCGMPAPDSGVDGGGDASTDAAP